MVDDSRKNVTADGQPHRRAAARAAFCPSTFPAAYLGCGRTLLGLLAVFVLASFVFLFPAPAQAQSEHVPDLQFTSPTTFQVHPETRMWARNTSRHRATNAGHRDHYFAALTGQDTDADRLTFTVEGRAGEASTYCFEEDCGAVSVGVLAESGNLYLGVDIDEPGSQRKSRNLRSTFEDFPPQRVEVAVQAGHQKVYQEVLVDAPANAPDCADYPEMNEDRYRCYFTREIVPAAFTEADSALVADLPGQLLQDREEYTLVFAEEFTGSYPPTSEQPDRCDRGLEELDGAKWNHPYRICREDPQGDPCLYLEDGHLHMSRTSQCGGDLQSRGLFEPRYGYVEIQYTIGAFRATSGERPNYNAVMGNLREAERHLLNTHNLDIDSLERLLTLTPWVEVDLFEYVPDGSFVISHQYRNWGPGRALVHHIDVRPMLTYKLRYFSSSYCSRPAWCANDRITITQGMEWTPEGYLFLERWHGRDATLQVIDKDNTIIYKAWRRLNDRWHFQAGGFGNDRRTVRGTERESYFVHPDPSDTAIYLEALGINHMPISISMSNWTASSSTVPTNTTQLTVDYIRVFQPRNRYADMEPLYQ